MHGIGHRVAMATSSSPELVMITDFNNPMLLLLLCPFRTTCHRVIATILPLRVDEGEDDGKKQANRELLLQTQLQEQQDCQQPQQSQPQIQPQPQEQEAEREILLPATTDTMARKSLFVLRPVHKYADLVCIALSVFAYLLETTMNAALAIFGIGVGVGLVLGDSFRAALPLLPSVQAQQQTTSNGTTTTANPATTIATRVENEIFLPRDVPNLLPAQ